jgi:RHS repeat-associated protein
VTKTDSGVVWSYGYDLAGRLVTVEKGGAPSATYTYDANGNRLTDGATYDEEDRQLTGGGATFTYTPNGERKTRVEAGGTTTYGYDGRGHLTSVVLPNGKQLVYGVDASGRRVSRSEDGVVTHRWLYRNQLQPVAEVDASGEVTTRYVYGTKVNVPDYFVRGGTTFRLLTDQLGSVRKVIDTTTGEVVQEIAYDAWGVVTKDTNPGLQPFGFAGGLWEGETGLTHFGAREYEARTGRWTRKDPIGFGGGTNTFAYADGSPVTFADPEGRFAIGAVAAGAVWGAIVGGATSAIWQWGTNCDHHIDRGDVFIAAAFGAINGGFSPFVPSLGGAVAFGTGSGLLQYGVTEWSNDRSPTWTGAYGAVVLGGLGGAAGGVAAGSGRLPFKVSGVFGNPSVAQRLNNADTLGRVLGSIGPRSVAAGLISNGPSGPPDP